MKSYKIALTILVAFFAINAFAQVQPSRMPVSHASTIPPGPLCLILINNKLFSIETNFVDSIIKPKTIKSLRIEKGAQAAAIYGYRSGNGVIIIEIENKIAKKEYNRIKSFLTRFGS